VRADRNEEDRGTGAVVQDCEKAAVEVGDCWEGAKGWALMTAKRERRAVGAPGEERKGGGEAADKEAGCCKQYDG
jgi:hypothetical protein